MTGIPHSKTKSSLWLALMLAGALCLVAALAAFTGSARADSPAAVLPQTGTPADNAACIGCHQQANMTLKLDKGDVLNLTVDLPAWEASIHGTSGLACTDCHASITGFPHDKVAVQTARDYTLQYTETCKQCHAKESSEQDDSIHAMLLKEGNINAATCSDCHDPHTQKLVYVDGKLTDEARVQIPVTCSRCHSAIYDQYTQSVHGAGILEGNPDVPTCADCHGVHTISDPATTQFKLSSVQSCAKCHTDASIMDKYGLNTNVLSTYVTDFHGTTTVLFNPENPYEQVNKPVCYDCHGIHNIVSIDDPTRGLAVKENILVTCQRCHPDATASFPDSWLSHYTPSAENTPLIFYVQLFYKILIPLVLGGMAFWIGTDIFRKIRTRGKAKSHAETVEVEKPAEEKGKED